MLIVQVKEGEAIEKALKKFKKKFEKTGVVSEDDARKVGTVGLSARMNGLNRDIRLSHPHDSYLEIHHQPIIKHHGDVYSRAQMRRQEIGQSIGYIRKLMKDLPDINTKRPELNSPAANTFTLSLVEGWRGEICHCAITDKNGELMLYKIKDPSFHNWMALALSVRNNEISDFPICNKSFTTFCCKSILGLSPTNSAVSLLITELSIGLRGT